MTEGESTSSPEEFWFWACAVAFVAMAPDWAVVSSVFLGIGTASLSAGKEGGLQSSRDLVGESAKILCFLLAPWIHPFV